MTKEKKKHTIADHSEKTRLNRAWVAVANILVFGWEAERRDSQKKIEHKEWNQKHICWYRFLFCANLFWNETSKSSLYHKNIWFFYFDMIFSAFPSNCIQSNIYFFLLKLNISQLCTNWRQTTCREKSMFMTTCTLTMKLLSSICTYKKFFWGLDFSMPCLVAPSLLPFLVFVGFFAFLLSFGWETRNEPYIIFLVRSILPPKELLHTLFMNSICCFLLSFWFSFFIFCFVLRCLIRFTQLFAVWFSIFFFAFLTVHETSCPQRESYQKMVNWNASTTRSSSAKQQGLLFFSLQTDFA